MTNRIQFGKSVIFFSNICIFTAIIFGGIGLFVLADTVMAEENIPQQAEDGTIELNAVMADIHNPVDGINAKLETYDGKPNIGYWADARTWIEWKVFIDTPGQFDVIAELAVNEPTSSFEVVIDDQIQTVSVSSTESYSHFSKVTLPQINIDQPGEHSLQIRPIMSKWNPINLRSITLIPIKHALNQETILEWVTQKCHPIYTFSCVDSALYASGDKLHLEIAISKSSYLSDRNSFSGDLYVLISLQDAFFFFNDQGQFLPFNPFSDTISSVFKYKTFENEPVGNIALLEYYFPEIINPLSLTFYAVLVKPDEHLTSETMTSNLSIHSINITKGINHEKLQHEISKLHIQPSDKALQNIMNYRMMSLSDSIKQGFSLILEEENEAILLQQQNMIRSIQIDGQLSDWENSGCIYEDNQNDTTPLNSSLPIEVYEPSDDLKRYGFIHGNDFMYCMVEPVTMPSEGTEYHYRINLLTPDNKLAYAIVWTSFRDVVQEWDTDSGTFIKYITTDDAVFAKKDVFEAKIPAEILYNLPQYYHIEAVVWHEYKNSLDVNWNPNLETSIETQYGYKYCLDVFCQYAEKMNLVPDDPFPIVQAITEGYIYKIAEDDIRPVIINDGLEMIKQAEQSMSYSFAGQKPLKELPIEALLSWADRSMMFGGYRYAGLSVLKSGQLNKDAYEFLVLHPSDLVTCRTMMDTHGLIDTQSLSNTMFNIEDWLWQKNKYRRYYIQTIIELYESNPEYWEVVYQESLEEHETGDVNIATVNGVDINKGSIFSASFEVNYLFQNSFFYGNCVDVTAIALAFHKAIGIPSIHFMYGLIADDYYKEIHSFPMYYSSQADTWFNYLNGGNNTGLGTYDVLYLIDRPQVGSNYQMFNKELPKGDSLVITTRTYPVRVSQSQWISINDDGYPMSELKKYMFNFITSSDTEFTSLETQ
ncbi:MAG: carbohydrate-binding protein [Desulfobacterales bacterium]|nr:carbohydrate-binding protein [Desulfobacterales bacterium]